MAVEQYLQSLIEEFQDLEVDLDNFQLILMGLEEINPSFALEHSIMPELFKYVQDAQQGQADIHGVISFIREFVIKQNTDENQEGNNDHVGKPSFFQNTSIECIQKADIPAEIQQLIENVQPDQLTEFKRIYELINPQKQETMEIDEIQRKIKEFKASELIKILFQILSVDNQVKQSDYFKLVTELEQNILGQFQEQTSAQQKYVDEMNLNIENSTQNTNKQSPQRKSQLDVPIIKEKQIRSEQKNQKNSYGQNNKNQQQQQNKAFSDSRNTKTSSQGEFQIESSQFVVQDYSQLSFAQQKKNKIMDYFNSVYKYIDVCKMANNSGDKKNISRGMKKILEQSQLVIAEMNLLIEEFENEEKQNSEFQSQIEFYKQKNIVLQNDIQNAEEYVLQMEQQLDKYVGDSDHYTKIIEEKEKVIQRLKNDLKDQTILENKLGVQTQKIKDLHQKLKEVTEERDDYYNKNLLNLETVEKYEKNAQENEMEETVKLQRKESKRQTDILFEENKKLQEQIKSYKQMCEKSYASIYEKDEQISNLEYEITQLNNQIQDLQQDINLLGQSKTKFQNSKNEFKNSVKNSVIPRFSMRQSVKFANDVFGDTSPQQKDSVLQQLFIGRASQVNENSQFIPIKTNQDNQQINEAINEDEDEDNQNNFQLVDDVSTTQNNIIKDIDWGAHIKEKVDQKVKQSIMVRQKQRQQPMFKFLQFDEASFYSRDYLNTRENPVIKQIIDKYIQDEIESSLNLKTFSDYIYRINSKEKRERRVIMVTSLNMFFMKPKSFKVIRKISLEKIEKITFSETSSSLCAIYVKNEFDYLIEIFRRTELNLFLIEVFKERKLPLFKMEFKEHFQFQQRDDIIQNIKDINQEQLLKQYEGAYKDAIYKGFLYMYKPKFFGSNWQEKFVVLSNVGLLIFDEPGQSKSQLIPIAGSMLIMDPLGIERPYTIKVFYNETNQEFFFSAQSKMDQEAWYDNMHKVIYKSLNANTMGKEKKQYKEAEQHKKTEIFIDM